MFQYDDAADFLASLDADLDFSAPLSDLTASDLGLEQFGQGVNQAEQCIWQCNNCSAVMLPGTQRFVRGLEDGLTKCVKRAKGVSCGFGGASECSVPRPDASMCCVMRKHVAAEPVHIGLQCCVIRRDAASQCSLLTDTGLEYFETCAQQ